MIKTILVTGGAGFIGSHLIDTLLAKQIKVICLDNFDGFYSRATKENNIKAASGSNLLTFIEGDIKNKNLVERIFKDHKIDLVIHLAAKAGVRPSILDPQEYFNVNLNGTINLLEAMRENNIQKLIFASSSSIYGNNEKIPYSESDDVSFPISPYAASKKGGELLTYNYHYLYHLNVINLRFFTVFGPRQRPDLAIHKFFNNLYNNTSIDMYGDGSTSRDYTFVNDTVSGILGAINYLETNSNVYEIINLGNHTPVKLSELITLIEEVTSKKFLIKKLPMQMGDVNVTFADISKAQKLLNYKPGTTLKEGLVVFKEWYEKTKNL